MNEERDYVAEVFYKKLAELEEMEPGTKEHSALASDVKTLADIQNNAVRLALDDENTKAKMENDAALKLAEIQETKKQNLINNILEGGKVILTGAVIWAGYRFDYKANGIAMGNTFKKVKTAFEGFKFRR